MIIHRDPQQSARLLNSQAMSLDVVDVSSYLTLKNAMVFPLPISHVKHAGHSPRAARLAIELTFFIPDSLIPTDTPHEA